MSKNDGGLTALAEATAQAKRDDFEIGTVVRWTMRYELAEHDYLYTAVKTEAGWYTSAKPGGTVPQVLSFKGLLSILSGTEARNVAVATQWLEPGAAAAQGTTAAQGPASEARSTPDRLSLDDLRRTFLTHMTSIQGSIDGTSVNINNLNEGLRAVLVQLGYTPPK